VELTLETTGISVGAIRQIKVIKTCFEVITKSGRLPPQMSFLDIANRQHIATEFVMCNRRRHYYQVIICTIR
jgi:hypothetical protein